MRVFTLTILAAASLGLAACGGKNPDPGAGNTMQEYRGPGTVQAAPAQTPVQPNSGSMSIAPASGGTVQAAPARQAQQPNSGSMSLPPATGGVTRTTQ